jgi:hypothetical protein
MDGDSEIAKSVAAIARKINNRLVFGAGWFSRNGPHRYPKQSKVS